MDLILMLLDFFLFSFFFFPFFFLFPFFVTPVLLTLGLKTSWFYIPSPSLECSVWLMWFGVWRHVFHSRVRIMQPWLQRHGERTHCTFYLYLSSLVVSVLLYLSSLVVSDRTAVSGYPREWAHPHKAPEGRTAILTSAVGAMISSFPFRTFSSHNHSCFP